MIFGLLTATLPSRRFVGALSDVGGKPGPVGCKERIEGLL